MQKSMSDVRWKLTGIARECGVSEATLKRYLKRGKIKVLKYRGAHWIHPAHAVILIERIQRSKCWESFATRRKLGYTYRVIDGQIETENSVGLDGKEKIKESPSSVYGASRFRPQMETRVRSDEREVE